MSIIPIKANGPINNWGYFLENKTDDKRHKKPYGRNDNAIQ